MYITDQLSTHGYLHHFHIKYPLKNTLLLDRGFLCNSHLFFIYSLQFVSRTFSLNILCSFAYAPYTTLDFLQMHENLQSTHYL